MAYQTTSPTDIDFMYKLPENMMIQAINTADQSIEKAQDQSDLFDKHISDIKALPYDQQVLLDKSTQYRNQIDQLRGNIQNDPANYRKYLPKVREISRGLSSDADLKTIQNRYNTVQDWQKTFDAAAMKGDVDPVLYGRVRQQLPELIKNTGYDPTTKQFGQLNLPTDISKPINWAKKNDDYIKDMKPVQDSAGAIISKDGKWLVETTEGRKYLAPSEIQKTWLKNFAADPEAQRWVGQANNYVGKDYGTTVANNAMEAAMSKYRINEGSKTKVNINPWEKEYWDTNQKVNGDILKRKHELDDQQTKLHQHAAELAGIVEAGKPTIDPTTGKTILASNDAIEAAKAAQAEAKFLNVDLGQLNTTIQKSAANNNQPVIQPKTTVNTSVNPVVPIPVKADTSSYAAQQVFNFYNGDNKLTPSKVIGKIQATESSIKDLENVLSNISDVPDNQDERGANIDAINNQKALLHNYQNTYAQATNDAITNLQKKGYKKEDIDIARQPSTLPTINNQIKQLKLQKEKLYPFDQFDSNIVQNDNTVKQIDIQLKTLNAQKNKYETIIDNYNKEQDKWFDDNSAQSSLQVDYIKAEPTQAKNLGSMIAARPKELTIIDPETGDDLSKKAYNNGVFSSKKTYSLSTDSENSLGSYLASQGKSLTDVITVTGISKPVPGFGVTATATIKAPGLDPKKQYLIKIPSDIATSYAQSITTKNGKQQEIKGDILNQAKGNFIESATSMFQDIDIPIGQQGITGEIPLKTPIKTDPTTGVLTGGKNIVLRITPVNIGGTIKYKLAGTTRNGGIFNSFQEIADMLYQ